MADAKARVRYLAESVYCLARSDVEELALPSYASVLDSFERSEVESPHDYGGCRPEQLRQLLNAQPSEKRQRSVRKSFMNRHASMQSSRCVNVAVSLLMLFPDPARLRGQLENFHPTLRSRNDMHLLALLHQSASDLRHFTMIACGFVGSAHAARLQLPQGANVLIAACLVPDGGLLHLSRPSPVMWYKFCRGSQRACFFKHRVRTIAHLVKVKSSAEERMVVMEIIFHSWRLAHL
eukprot:TRINITY_DN10075_c0_g1_i3.p1 TRINITY_DN10075_c0_g1~~TRINITY_DN10075_c0_g1_i3.p1  ORF type:complete len:236 (+),score=13.42 TRINITY_DN10075_c0_g1_i3:44-751(+)